MNEIKLSEAQIEDQILQFLNLSGWFAWKNITAGYFDEEKGHYRKHVSRWAITGSSDIIALKDGITLFLEVKTEKGRQSDAQKAFEMRVKEKGNKYHIIRSVEDTKAIITSCAKPLTSCNPDTV
jgi:hypothetical protein